MVLGLILAFLGGSATATLLQVHAEWRRRRADRLIAGAEGFLTAAEGAIASLDRVTEAGANHIEIESKVKSTFGRIAKAGGPLTTASEAPELARFGELMLEVQGMPALSGEQEAAAARATVERVQIAIPEVLEGIEDASARREAAELGPRSQCQRACGHQPA